jgi:hypothetical protein
MPVDWGRCGRSLRGSLTRPVLYYDPGMTLAAACMLIVIFVFSGRRVHRQPLKALADARATTPGDDASMVVALSLRGVARVCRL